jgi:hypothetical protein
MTEIAAYSTGCTTAATQHADTSDRTLSFVCLQGVSRVRACAALCGLSLCLCRVPGVWQTGSSHFRRALLVAWEVGGPRYVHSSHDWLLVGE